MNSIAQASTVTPTPSDQRTSCVLSRAADSIREHGATPEQAAAMAEISQILADADDPAALAARVLARIAAERADREINEQVARQHPHMKPITDRSTWDCVYDGTPSVTVSTGQLGNRYGLCADCAEITAAMAGDTTMIATLADEQVTA